MYSKGLQIYFFRAKIDGAEFLCAFCWHQNAVHFNIILSVMGVKVTILLPKMLILCSIFTFNHQLNKMCSNWMADDYWNISDLCPKAFISKRLDYKMGSFWTYVYKISIFCSKHGHFDSQNTNTLFELTASWWHSKTYLKLCSNQFWPD